MMSSKSLKLAAISLLLIASPALAEPVKIVRDGVEGIWFPLASAKKLLNVDSELTTTKSQILLYKQKIELKDSNLNLLRENLQLEKQVSSKAMTKAVELEKINLDLQKSSTSWYRSPVLWFVAGIAITVAATVGVVYAADKK